MIAPIDGESRFFIFSVVRSQCPISCIHLPWRWVCIVDMSQATDIAARCPPTRAGLAKSVPSIQPAGSAAATRRRLVPLETVPASAIRAGNSRRPDRCATAVATQYAQSDLFPRTSVSPRMPITAHRVGLPLDGLVRMLIAVRLTIRNKRTATPVLAGLHRSGGHRRTSRGWDT
ncbi:hypothetical protein [Burkholderia sp. Bp9012]|uniref:hypothetical protein n=1 Tax=Burkholderia sp. Bp9012 TaxID=2184562 RepID=UPI001628EBDD|nr:hypothetical protein [Burkholderia sp. Bp9012]